jgi:hypothetical protein
MQPATALAGQPNPAPAVSPLEAHRQRVAPFYAGIRAKYASADCAAIRTVYEAAKTMLDTGGGSRCAKLLLGLYNGTRFPFDLTDLRCLDGRLYAAAMQVLDMDARRTYTEVHELLNAIYADGRNVGAELECWAWRLRWGKHVKKAGVPTDFGPKWQVEGAAS